MEKNLTKEQTERLNNTIKKALDLAHEKYGFNRMINPDGLIETLGMYNNYADDYGKEQERLNIRDLAKALAQVELFCQLIDGQETLKLKNGKKIEFTQLGGKIIGHVIW